MINLKKSSLIKISLALAVLSTLVSFQNCSKVPLEQKSLSLDYHANGEATFCLDGPYANYTIKNYTVTNLNILNTRSTISVDTDADGLSDIEEKQRGSNPLKRYSSGRVLDSICLSLTGTVDCSSMNLSCLGTDTKLGLKDCDLEVLGLDHFTNPNPGLDSDGDGFVDFVEIIKGTSANVSDATADPDKDLVLNQDEIRQGTNPLYSDRNQIAAAQLIQSSMTQKSDATCAGETWKLKIDQIPLVSVRAFTDVDDVGRASENLKFSHADDENLILISLILSVKNGFSGNTLVLTQTVPASLHDDGLTKLNLNFQNFKKVGEVNP